MIDLVPHSTVKVDDVTVGKITGHLAPRLHRGRHHAAPTTRISPTTPSPRSSRPACSARSTSQLAAPHRCAERQPADHGDTIPLSRTGQNPRSRRCSARCQPAAQRRRRGPARDDHPDELNTALTAARARARLVLHQARHVQRPAGLPAGPRSSGRCSARPAVRSLNRQRSTIDAALGELPGGLTVSAGQRHDLVRMLKALAHLGDVGTHVIRAVEGLHDPRPCAAQPGARAGSTTPAATSSNVLPGGADLPLRRPGRRPRRPATADGRLHQPGHQARPLPRRPGQPAAAVGPALSLPTLPTQLPTSLPTSEITQILGDIGKYLKSGDITSQACQKVLADPQELLQLVAKCRQEKHRSNPVCQVLDSLPSLPTAGTGLPSITLAPSDLPSLPLLDGLGRPAFGPRGPTMRPAARIYDPGLVSLLLPGWWWTGDHPSYEGAAAPSSR